MALNILGTYSQIVLGIYAAFPLTTMNSSISASLGYHCPTEPPSLPVPSAFLVPQAITNMCDQCSQGHPYSS